MADVPMCCIQILSKFKGTQLINTSINLDEKKSLVHLDIKVITCTKFHLDSLKMKSATRQASHVNCC